MMKKQPAPNLNELMIVNPGVPGGEEFLGLKQVLRGEKGTYHRVEGLFADDGPEGLAEFYLGADGTLYRLARPEPTDGLMHGGNARHGSSLPEKTTPKKSTCGRYFLGDDGTLYEKIG